MKLSRSQIHDLEDLSWCDIVNSYMKSYILGQLKLSEDFDKKICSFFDDYEDDIIRVILEYIDLDNKNITYSIYSDLFTIEKVTDKDTFTITINQAFELRSNYI